MPIEANVSLPARIRTDTLGQEQTRPSGCFQDG